MVKIGLNWESDVVMIFRECSLWGSSLSCTWFSNLMNNIQSTNENFIPYFLTKNWFS